MQKAKGNHHKMSEKQSDEHIIPIVAVGEYDSATRDKGLSSAGVKNNTPEGSPSIAGVENNSKKLSVFEKMGQVAAKAVHVIREAYAAERIDVDAKRPENDEGVMERLGFPGNTENQTNNSGALEGSADTSKSSANKPEADDDEDDIPAYLRPRKKTSDGTKSTSGEQASSANKPEAEEGKVNTPQVEKTSDGTKSTSEKQASSANKPEADDDEDGIPAFLRRRKNAGEGTKSTSEKQAPDTNKPKTTNSKANTPDTSVDTSGKNAGGGTKSTSEKQDSNAKPKAEKGKADASQGKQAPDAAKDFMSDFLDRIKQDQDQVSPEKREAADELEKAKDRHSKAYAAAESKNPLGKKRRQAELKAATEQLKKCELLDKAADKLDESRERFAKASVDVESHFFKRKKRQEELNAATEELKKSGLGCMSIKFADKIEAAKQDPEKQAELAAEMAQAVFASMQETSRVTADKYDNMLDDRSRFKKAAAQVGKWFNKGGRVRRCLKLGSVGFVAGTATGFFAGYAGYAGFPITTAVGAVTGLGVAGLTKQAVLEEHRGEDRIAADARLETTDPSFKNTVANMKIDDVMEHAVNVSVDNLKDMSIERQDDLRKRTRRAMTKYGIGFALGGVFGSSINHLWNNSAHATGAGSQKASTTPSQSGGEQIPQQPSGASSIDNSAAKAIVNNINPDTSNFNSYDYPWDWAAEKFGNANAMDQLHNLADKAMADGHTIQLLNNPDGSVYIEVDGSSATEHVLGVLSRYV